MEDQRVVTQEDFGPPEVLHVERRPLPEPLPTEVRVRVRAAGVNPADAKTRAGAGMARILGRPPFVLGWDVAGVVDLVGYGVTRFRVGDRVMGMPLFPREAGGYSEFVAAPSRHFVPIPEELTDEQAAALPLAGLTAWQALVDVADVQEGQRVLVHAAAGGVGHLAVQVAKARGAWVAGTASRPKHGYLASLGIDQPVDYRTADVGEVVGEVDIVVDLVGDDSSRRSVTTIRPGGVFVAVQGQVTDELTEAASARDVRVEKLLVEPDCAGLEALAELGALGRLHVLVTDSFSFTEASEAHRAIETGRTTGKIVLHP